MATLAILGSLLREGCDSAEALAARERQIDRQAEEAAVQQGVMQQLQARTEELAMAKARVSEQDVAELQR